MITPSSFRAFADICSLVNDSAISALFVWGGGVKTMLLSFSGK